MSTETYCRLVPKTGRLEMLVTLDLPADISSKTELLDIIQGPDGCPTTQVKNIINQAWDHIQRFRALQPGEKK